MSGTRQSSQDRAARAADDVLASPQTSSYITGEILPIIGGY